MEAELDKTIRQSQVKWEICIGRSVVAINIASISFFGDLLCESAQKTWEKIKDFSFTSFWKNQNLIAGLNAVKSSLYSASTSFFGDLLCESAQKTWEKIKDFSFTSFWKNQNLIAGLNAVKSSLCSLVNLAKEVGRQLTKGLLQWEFLPSSTNSDASRWQPEPKARFSTKPFEDAVLLWFELFFNRQQI